MHTICNISTKYYKSAACRTQRAGGEWSVYGGTYKKCKRLWTKPGIRWLCGYFFVLLCGVGLVYYWRVAYSLGAGMPGFAAATTLIICGGFSAVYLLVFLAAHSSNRTWL